MTRPGPTPVRPCRAARAGRGLLAALVGLLLVLAAVVVGAVPAAAQNRVGASTPTAANTVGSPAGISAGQRLGNTGPQPQIVVATAVAANTEAVLVDGAGSGTRAINFRPNASDPNWGLTRAHVEKHLFGDGPTSLRSIDPAGTSDQWVAYMQDLAGRPATATLKGGIQDIVGTFPKADGSGSFRFGIRIAPGDNGTFDLVTLLTRQ